MGEVGVPGGGRRLRESQVHTGMGSPHLGKWSGHDSLLYPLTPLFPCCREQPLLLPLLPSCQPKKGNTHVKIEKPYYSAKRPF